MSRLDGTPWMSATVRRGRSRFAFRAAVFTRAAAGFAAGLAAAPGVDAAGLAAWLAIGLAADLALGLVTGLTAGFGGAGFAPALAATFRISRTAFRAFTATFRALACTFRAAAFGFGIAAIFRAAPSALRATTAALRAAFFTSFFALALAVAIRRVAPERAPQTALRAVARRPAAAFETVRTAFLAVFFARAAAGRAGFLLAMAVSFRLLDSRR